MLRYKETEDIEARFAEVDTVVLEWRDRLTRVDEALTRELRSRVRISMIHHDAALEGEVLSYSEIKASIDPSIISDTSLIPSYESIKNFNAACEMASEIATSKRKPLKLDTIRDLCAVLSPEEGAKGVPYRKENPLHRLYYHDICPPEKITYQMKKLGEWIEEPGTRDMHPIDRCAHLHFKLMAVFPWAKETGRVARIVSNLILEEASYPIAIIHSIDRQKYYEALRTDTTAVLSLYLEAVQTTAESELKVYDEAAKSPRLHRG